MPRTDISDIRDVKADIQRVLTDPSGVLVQPVTDSGTSDEAANDTAVGCSCVVLTAIIAGVAVWKLKPPEPRQVMRFDYELPEGQQFDNLDFQVLAVSPDGKQFVYSTTKGLYLRSVDELDAKLIAGTEGKPDVAVLLTRWQMDWILFPAMIKS